MRATEALQFLKKNPVEDDYYLFTHIYVISLKKRMKIDKEFRQLVKRRRKQHKKKIAHQTEIIDLFADE